MVDEELAARRYVVQSRANGVTQYHPDYQAALASADALSQKYNHDIAVYELIGVFGRPKVPATFVRVSDGKENENN